MSLDYWRNIVLRYFPPELLQVDGFGLSDEEIELVRRDQLGSPIPTQVESYLRACGGGAFAVPLDGSRVNGIYRRCPVFLPDSSRPWIYSEFSLACEVLQSELIPDPVKLLQGHFVLAAQAGYWVLSLRSHDPYLWVTSENDLPKRSHTTFEDWVDGRFAEVADMLRSHKYRFEPNKGEFE